MHHPMSSAAVPQTTTAPSKSGIKCPIERLGLRGVPLRLSMAVAQSICDHQGEGTDLCVVQEKVGRIIANLMERPGENVPSYRVWQALAPLWLIETSGLTFITHGTGPVPEVITGQDGVHRIKLKTDAGSKIPVVRDADRSSNRRPPRMKNAGVRQGHRPIH